jgi:hypothetical protein
MAGTPHNNLTGAAAVHPSAYIQSTDPGAVGANKSWYDSATSPYTHKVRNATNTAWVAVGISASSLDGLSDVVITSPLSGQSLVYNSAISQWVNRRSPGEALYLAATCI